MRRRRRCSSSRVGWCRLLLWWWSHPAPALPYAVQPRPPSAVPAFLSGVSSGGARKLAELADNSLESASHPCTKWLTRQGLGNSLEQEARTRQVRTSSASPLRQRASVSDKLGKSSQARARNSATRASGQAGQARQVSKWASSGKLGQAGHGSGQGLGKPGSAAWVWTSYGHALLPPLPCFVVSQNPRHNQLRATGVISNNPRASPPFAFFFLPGASTGSSQTRRRS
eukprot:gene12990-biopygen4990